MPPSPFETGLNREIGRLRTANRMLRFQAGLRPRCPEVGFVNSMHCAQGD